MPKNNYKHIQANGHTFSFKYEEDAPELLHIWVRHLTEPVDAIYTFFTGTTAYNEKHERFETETETHTVYWLWLDKKKKKVLIITCFTT